MYKIRELWNGVWRYIGASSLKEAGVRKIWKGNQQSQLTKLEFFAGQNEFLAHAIETLTKAGGWCRYLRPRGFPLRNGGKPHWSLIAWWGWRARLLDFAEIRDRQTSFSFFPPLLHVLRLNPSMFSRRIINFNLRAKNSIYLTLTLPQLI